jgi:hypothetical protein
VSPNDPPPHDYSYRIPPDLQHVVSSATLKILEGGLCQSFKPTKNQWKDKKKSIEGMETAMKSRPCSRLLRRLTVKKDVKVDAHRRGEKPTLDISLPHVCLLSLYPSNLITV